MALDNHDVKNMQIWAEAMCAGFNRFSLLLVIIAIKLVVLIFKGV